MIEREKVLTWLEICGKNDDCSGCCPYSENGFGEYGQCRESLMADAYDLLTEQEAVEPRRIDGKYNHFIKCGNCNYDLLTGYIFCPHCGKELKWDEENTRKS